MMDYLNLKQLTDRHREEIQAAVARVVGSGWYLKGEATAAFEREWADFVGTRYCVACGNGLDALTLILRAWMEMGRLKEGDEVIVPANTYIASILAITENRLKPVLVEPDIDTLQIDDNKIEAHITERTRVLMLVHLYGRCACTQKILDLCHRYHLLLMEDNAQAHGCFFSAECRVQSAECKRTGALGHAAAHSFYPGKNLGALGDAGAVTTDDDELAETVRALGNYGSSRKYVFPYQGRNSRMDEIQAAVLSVKLKYLDEENQMRRRLAAVYARELNHSAVHVPKCPDRDHVYHIFPVLCPERDRLQQHLAAQGIQTLIHYPIPPHKQACYQAWNHLSLPVTEQIHREELSLPLHPALTEEDICRVAAAVNNFSIERI